MYLYLLEVDWDDVFIILESFCIELCKYFINVIIVVGCYIFECVEEVL